MRRVIASAVLAAAMLVATGCGDSTDSATGTTPSTGTTSAAADNTMQVCASAEKALAEGLEDFTKAVTAVVTAAATDNEAGVAAGIQAVKDAFQSWSAILQAEAAKATNPELKAAMTLFATEIEKQLASINTAEDVEKFADSPDTPEMTQAQEALERLCPSSGSTPTPGASS